jgi:hypothetical protein
MLVVCTFDLIWELGVLSTSKLKTFVFCWVISVESWVRGKCEEAMREVLGAGRGVQAGEVEIPAMVAEAGRETRQGAESDEESDGCDGDKIASVRVRNTTY